MKRKLASYLTIPVLLSFGQAYAAVTLYDNSNYSGFNTVLYSNKSIKNTSSELGMHDTISSLTVGAGECAILFRDSNFSGTVKYFGPGAYPDLRDYGFNDEASSLHILSTDSCNSSDLTFFHIDANYNGPKFGVIKGYSGDLTPFWNDEISSISLGSDHCAVVYRNGSYSGTKKEFTHNVGTLSSYSFNDTISTYQITSVNNCLDPEPISGGGSGGGSDDDGNKNQH